MSVPRTSSNQRGLERVWIHSTGETPRCGTGKRLVLADIGRRIVRIRPASNPDRHADRVSRDTYERLLLGGAA